MIFSYLKLKELAKLKKSTTVDEVVEAINTIGFEVEEVKPFLNVGGIKYGHILEVSQNPQGNLLTVCKIGFADKERIIQTTATNLKANDYVLAFVPGSTLGKVTLEAKRLKGIVSEGMLVSLEELGYQKELLREEEWDGIFVLEEKVDLNDDPIKDLHLDDYLIDVSVLPNRSDANAYLIMALEIGAYFHTLKPYENKTTEYPLFHDPQVHFQDLAHNFILARNQKALKLSLLDKLLLLKSDIKSVNDAVDFGNLIFIMTGCPCHVYRNEDLEKEVSLKRYTGEMKVLGNKTIKLKNNLVITSDNRLLTLAGTIGSQEAALKDNRTEKLTWEIANFYNVDIAKNALAAKLNTKSSNQSSKDSGDGMLSLALDYMNQFFDHKMTISSNIKPFNRYIDFKKEEIFDHLVTEKHDLSEFDDTFKSLNILGFVFEDERVKIPEYRHDLALKEDIIEEILRFYGLNKILPLESPSYPTLLTEESTLNKALPLMGYQEVKTYNLISLEKNNFNPFDFEKTWKLKTFISKEREVIRQSLLESFWEVINYNYKRNIEQINIYEIGRINNSIDILGITSTTKTLRQLLNDALKVIPFEDVRFANFESEFFLKNHAIKIYHHDELIGYVAKMSPKMFAIDFVFGELFADKLHKNTRVLSQDFNKNALKTYDLNFNINEKSQMATFVSHFTENKNIFAWNIVDQYKVEEHTVVTIRFFLFSEKSDQTIAELNALVEAEA